MINKLGMCVFVPMGEIVSFYVILFTIFYSYCLLLCEILFLVFLCLFCNLVGIWGTRAMTEDNKLLKELL